MGTLKLSDEISLGRMLLRPVPGTFNDGEGGGCAFGMANAARGDHLAISRHPWVSQMQGFITLPCNCTSERVMGAGMVHFPQKSITTYADAIVHIFNYHICTVKDWTMDQLIDFVKRVEPPEEAVPAEAERELISAK